MLSVTLESTLNGSAAGHLELTISPEETIDSLISNFCIEKGIRYKHQFVLKNQQNVLLDSLKTIAANGINDGDILFLTTKNEEQKIFGFSNWWILCSVAFVIGLIGILVISLLFSMPGTRPPNYGIVFDAGSTHTDMMLYSWNAPKDHDTGIVKQVDVCKVNGSGIASFAQHPEKAGESLEACLKSALSHIPQQERSDSLVFLGATGGMRLLEEINSTLALEIMASIDKTLANSGFNYHSNNSRIITGQEESVSGWITANYLYDRLGNAKHYSSMDTYGALDLGGASTQISFVSRTNDTNIYTNDFVPIRLYGVDYNVYSESFLCFGQKEFTRRYHVQLIKDAFNINISHQINDPCGLKGNNQTRHFSELFNLPCTLPLPDKFFPNTTMEFVGEGNYIKCNAVVHNLLDATQCAQMNYKHCFNYANKPDVKGKFVAFSAFYFIVNYFNLTSNLTLDAFRDTISRFCSEDGSEVTDNYAKNYCLSGNYIINMLNSTYKFDSWENIIVADKKNGIDLGWSLGFMTNATNIIPLEAQEKFMSVAAFAVLMLLFIIFLLIGAAFAYHGYHQNHRTSTYQRLSQYGAI